MAWAWGAHSEIRGELWDRRSLVANQTTVTSALRNCSWCNALGCDGQCSAGSCCKSCEGGAPCRGVSPWGVPFEQENDEQERLALEAWVKEKVEQLYSVTNSVEARIALGDEANWVPFGLVLHRSEWPFQRELVGEATGSPVMAIRVLGPIESGYNDDGFKSLGQQYWQVHQQYLQNQPIYQDPCPNQSVPEEDGKCVWVMKLEYASTAFLEKINGCFDPDHWECLSYLGHCQSYVTDTKEQKCTTESIAPVVTLYYDGLGPHGVGPAEVIKVIPGPVHHQCECYSGPRIPKPATASASSGGGGGPPSGDEKNKIRDYIAIYGRAPSWATREQVIRAMGPSFRMNGQVRPIPVQARK